jgi:hypothetical protein
MFGRYDMIKVFEDGIRSVLAGVCCAAVMVCSGVSMVNDVSGMDTEIRMPTIAYSQNEGSALAGYHRYLADPKMGFKYFMPRTECELNSLYRLSASESAVASTICDRIASNIHSEFYFRFEDNDKRVIDEYLHWFSSFVEISDRFHDQSFLEVLRNNRAVGIKYALVSFIVSSESYLGESNTSRESTCLPYTVCEIDKILTASTSLQHIKLAEFYRTHYLTSEFVDSLECQDMLSAIEKTFEEKAVFAFKSEDS